MKVKVMRLKSDYLLKSSLLYFDIFTHWQGKKARLFNLALRWKAKWMGEKILNGNCGILNSSKKQKKISALAKMVQKNKGT